MLASYATLDRSPSVQYAGLASRVPAVLPLLRALSSGGDQRDRLSRLQDFLDGLEAVATQLTTEPRRPARADVVRLLLASDIHDNVFGARAAARLAAGGGEPVDGILLAGDLTDTGTAEEAQLFLRVFGRPAAPVLLVGGNHEDAPAMRVVPRAPASTCLRDTTVVGGRRDVLGASDPVAVDAPGLLRRAGLAAGGVRLDALWRAGPAAAAGAARARRAAGAGRDRLRAGRGRALVVAYGNDHVAGVTTDDGVVLVDAGHRRRVRLRGDRRRVAAGRRPGESRRPSRATCTRSS